MSIRKIQFIEGEFYHIYNRGNSKQKIFHDKNDYERFVNLLFLSNTSNSFNSYNLFKDGHLYDFDRDETLVDIGAYCLMPNHFHVLVKAKMEGGISKFMQKLTTAYVMYYNQKYERTGSLFEGKFKSQYLGDDRYLKYIFSYIHLNPVKLIEPKWKELGLKDKNKAISFLIEYKYSSYLDYKKTSREQTVIINRKSFPDYFPTRRYFDDEILDWINYQL
jgi:putative transposase